MNVSCHACPIRKLSLFKPMRDGDVAAMDRFKTGELRIDPGTPLLLEGSGSAQLFTCLSGQGVRHKTLPDGNRQVLNFIFPGDFIGLQAAVMDEMQHSAEASTDMVLCVFDRSALYDFFRQHPERGFDLTWAAALEEHFLGDALVTLGQRTALERVAWAFVRVWLRLAPMMPDGARAVPFPHRQQDLADALGLSLVHTNKTLARLRSMQVAAWRDGELTISDWDRLCDLAQLPRDTSLPLRPLF